MDVLVLGGGVCGLGTAMMLARDGHEVTVLERDRDGPPVSVDEAAEAWERPGVAQFNQPHYVHARFRHVLDENLPDVRDRLVAAGALKFDLVNEIMAPTVEDRSPREGDERFWTLTGRRPCLELPFAQAAEDETGVKVARGAHVNGFVTGGEAIPGVPNIVGVRLADGSEMRADVVIDAMGRRSETPQWIVDVGGVEPNEEAEDCGFTYYGRYFRSRDGSLPEVKSPLLSPAGSISILSLPGDNDTWMLATYSASNDTEMKQLRFEDKWRRVLSAFPSHAHWLDGEPLGDFLAMAGIMDRRRTFAVDGKPVATGLLPVADAWACTNPSLGRGISLGMWHASRLRDLLRTANGDAGAVATEWHAITESELVPWYEAQIQMDRARVAEINDIRAGIERPPSDDMQTKMTLAFFTAAQFDPDCFRMFLEVMGCLATPMEILSRPGAFEKVIGASEGRELPPIPGPTRAELLELVA
jgi:2-polyprenyl-6-methoxyphenol hydroxylase-like FAD-dependent oxidoreductase